MSNRSERTAFIEILASLKERQKTMQSKKLDKLIHLTTLWVKKLYKEAEVDKLNTEEIV